MKIGLIIYPEFSLYEIAPLTSQLVLNYHQTVDIIAEEKKLYISEDGFQIFPKYSIDQLDLTEYDALLFTGTMNVFDVLFNNKLLGHLSSINTSRTLLASISSATLILAKAGLLNNRKFTGGIYTNYFNTFPWLNIDNFIKKHCTKNGKLITALGTKDGVSSFTSSVLYELGFIDLEPNLPDDNISFTMSDEEFETILLELRKLYPNQF